MADYRDGLEDRMTLGSLAQVPPHRRTTRTRHRTGPIETYRWDERRDGEFTEIALQHKLKALGYDPLPRSNPAGVIVSARVHHRARAEAVIAGLLKVTIDEESVILTAGDIVVVPGGEVRRIEPVGSSPVLCIEAVGRSVRA